MVTRSNLLLRYIPLSLIMLIFSFNVYSQENYDENVLKLIDKLEIYPNRTKYIDDLRENFMLANRHDEQTIDELRKRGEPDRFYGMYVAMNRILLRQQAVTTLPESTLKRVNPEFSDYALDIEKVKENAAVYFYAHAKKLMSTGKTEEARQAYLELLTLMQLYPGYRDTDKLVREAIIKSANRIDFEVINETGKKLSDPMIAQLIGVFLDYKNPEPGKGEKNYLFDIHIHLTDLDVTADQIKSTNYREERDVIDENGSTVDTLWCEVTENKMRKSATLRGVVEYYDLGRKRVVQRVPVSVESIYLNSYGTLMGNPEAASEETIKLVNKKMPEYPSSDSLVKDAVDKFSDHLRQIIWQQAPVTKNH